MNGKTDPDYYVTRLTAERDAAASATCDNARTAHEALADHYLQLLAACGHPAVVNPDPAHAGFDSPAPGRSMKLPRLFGS
jgi:hypothetical protein